MLSSNIYVSIQLKHGTLYPHHRLAKPQIRQPSTLLQPVFSQSLRSPKQFSNYQGIKFDIKNSNERLKYRLPRDRYDLGRREGEDYFYRDISILLRLCKTCSDRSETHLISKIEALESSKSQARGHVSPFSARHLERFSVAGSNGMAKTFYFRDACGFFD